MASPERSLPQEVSEAEQRRLAFLQTHKRDPITDEIVGTNHYIRRCVGGLVTYERPIGSKNLWYESGEPAGRWVRDPQNTKGFMHDPEAKHIAYVPPPSADQLMKNRLDEKESENEALRRELAAMKAEREAREKQQLED